eukprot:scaffold27416_cov129-Isochrysis_galbana.AAC.1
MKPAEAKSRRTPSASSTITVLGMRQNMPSEAQVFLHVWAISPYAETAPHSAAKGWQDVPAH